MNKKSLLFFLLGSSFLFAQTSKPNEPSIYKDIAQAYRSGFYPGVVTNAELMEKNYPDSVYMLDVMVMKSDALIQIGNYEEALTDLKETISLLHSGMPEYGTCYYLLGQIYYYTKEYDSSYDAFSRCVTEALKTDFMDHYYSSVLYGGRIKYLQKNYAEAVSFFKKVIQNGSKFSKTEYSEACEKYMECCNLQKDYKSTIDLYTKLKKENSTNINMTRCAADAYELSNQLQKSQELYSTEIPSGNRAVEFWINYGIDSYKKGDNQKALENFNKAKNVPEADYSQYEVIVQYYELIIKEEKILKNDKKIENLELLDEEFKNLEKSVTAKGDLKLSDAFYSNYLLCKIQEEKWNEAHKIFSKIKTPSDLDNYGEAYCFYKEENYQKTINILEPFLNKNSLIENPDMGVLLAQSYEKKGDVKKAWKCWSKLDDKNLLNDRTRLEYAKCLFSDHLYKEALNQTEKIQTKNEDRNYIAGMCCINLLDWINAEKNLLDCKNDYGKFYRNYAVYRQEKFTEAYKGFKNLTETASNPAVIRQSYNFAAKCGVQTGDFAGAASLAEKLIELCSDKNEKEDAVIFCAEIYSDAGNYEKTKTILEPYADEKSEFGVKVLFLLASTCSKTGEISKAEEDYQKIYRNFPGTEEAEEALYRCGEVYYQKDDYENARTRFSSYLNAYSDGKYSDAAYFYAGDCCIKQGKIRDNLNLSVVMNKTLVSRYPDSVYLYGAYRNLMDAEYSLEDYEEALNYGKILIADFNEQAVKDGIGKKVIELEQIAGGTDKNIVEKNAVYEENGGSDTVEGRKIGTEIAVLYNQNTETKDKAYRLAVELFSKEKIPEEALDAARNAQIIAENYSDGGKYEDAGNMFLKAAQYYRIGGENQDISADAALALYNAVENFRNAGLRGDAQEVAELLISLYPDSKQAKNVKNLLRK